MNRIRKSLRLRNAQRGMTLLEIMIAIVVLSVGAAVTLGTMTTTAKVDATMDQRAIALRAVCSQMERIRGYDYGTEFQDFIDHWSDPSNATFEVEGLHAPSSEYGGTKAGGTVLQAGARGRASGSITVDASDASRVGVTVTVAWQGAHGAETASLPMTFTGVIP